jgi:hypothetical protein
MDNIGTSIAESYCSSLSAIGLDCASTVFRLNLWGLSVVVFAGILVWLVAYFIHRYNRLDKMMPLHLVQHKKGAVNYKKTLVLNSHRMADLVGMSELKTKGLRAAATELNSKYGKRYFVVEFRESGSFLMRTELRVRAGWKNYPDDEIRVDPDTLHKLKAKSASDDDDDTDQKRGAIGEFDLFLRRVRPYDFRHWLLHPNREIRLAIWVAIFAASLEYSADLIELFRAFVDRV